MLNRAAFVLKGQVSSRNNNTLKSIKHQALISCRDVHFILRFSRAPSSPVSPRLRGKSEGISHPVANLEEFYPLHQDQKNRKLWNCSRSEPVETHIHSLAR